MPRFTAVNTGSSQRSSKLSVTARLTVMLLGVAVGIVLVFVLTLQGLKRTNTELQRLTNLELEQLITSTRLMQQSEMVASYARLVAQTTNLGERRLNMMELTDRMQWLDKLLGELLVSGEMHRIDPAVADKRQALQANVAHLSNAIFEPSQHAEDESQIAKLVVENQNLTTDMALIASRAGADMRRELNERGRQLAQDVANQQEHLNWLVAALVLCVIGAGIYIDGAVSRRIVALQREVREDEFGGIHSADPERSGDEIDQLATAIASYKKHLGDHTRAAQNAVRAKNRFLAGASHDLRQPVQALNLFLETLRGSGLTAAQANILEHARAASAASREMLDTLMDYSRIEAGVLEPKMQPVAVASLLRRLEKEYGPQADSKGLVFRVRDSEDWVYTDQTLLFMLLRNLVSNALRYTERGGVLIGVRRRGKQRCIEVWDTGIGIDDRHHELIFQEFRQVDEDNSAGHKGLGLGLAIVRELADILNVQVTLTSRPGRGSSFRITLMAEAAPPGGYGLVAGLWDAGDDGHYPPLPGLHVLVVDDEPLVRVGLTSMLEQWQCTVHSAATVGQVRRLLSRLQLAGQPMFDVVLTDLRLSKTEDGSMVVMAVRDAIAHHKPWQQMPPQYLILTGDTAPERLQMANGLGAVLLHKPIDPRVLHARLLQEWSLRQQLAQASTSAPTPALTAALPADDPDHPG